MNKQIEEMPVEELVAFLWHNTNMYDEDLIFDVAEALVNAKYSKQIDGEWILHEDGSGTCKNCNTHQKHIWDMDGWQNFCGHCGAKMKGVNNE